jgi:DNA-binding GntR family transcriptional regulator
MPSVKKTGRSRGNQRERVYLHIRRALMSGAYDPGQRVTVASLSSALGVSGMPVREALRLLAAERALEIQPSRSATVPRLSRVDILKVREVRELIEGYAAAQAARRITPPELEEVTQHQIAAAAARNRHDGKAILRHNEEFHFRIYEAARIPTLVDVIAVLWLHSAPTMNVMFLPDFLQRYPAKIQNKNNEALVRALRAGDSEGAAQAVRSEIATGSKLIDEIMREIDWDGADDASPIFDQKWPQRPRK